MSDKPHPPGLALAIAHLEQRIQQDASNPKIFALAKKSSDGEFRPTGQAHAIALELAHRKGSLDHMILAPMVDEDDWCLALGSALVSLGIETSIVAERVGEHSWTVRIHFRDGVEWEPALSMAEASRLVVDSMEPE